MNRLCHTRAVRRLSAIALGSLLLIAVSCGSDSDGQAENGPPAAAPTVAGVAADLQQPESAIAAQVVLAGLEQGTSIQMRALPGIDQPVLAEIDASDQITSLDQLFETEDGVQWIQIQAVSMQGWIPDVLAFRGPTQDITDQAVATVGSNTFGTPEEAASFLSADLAAAQPGDSQIVVVAMTTVTGTGSTTIVTDVLGEPDDSVLGSRLTIALDSSDGWVPVSVVQSVLCVRGVDADGLCI